MSRRASDTDTLLVALNVGSDRARCDALRALCPCRNNQVRDLAVWREIFRKARDGGTNERHQAAHAIGTLTRKALTSTRWRGLMQALKGDLDVVMRDPRAARMLLGEMKQSRDAQRSATRQNYRRRRKALDLATPGELAAWVNRRQRLDGRRRVSGDDPGVQRLWLWMKHRVTFQPSRRTSEDELVTKARRYLPRLFQRPA